MSYEYKVVPAPTRGLKAKGIKTAEERFANALQTEMNTLAADGWDYLRTDTLPSEQREGLMGKTTVYQNMLVFRRPLKAKQESAPKQAEALKPIARPTPPVVTEKTGDERLAEKKKVTPPTPVVAPKPPSSDVAAE
ncbi:DUF4177 domain-containing protein [Yoonia sp. BS5-3]|uniref:DUF4177 domain-containing protein n=1 Tax=Yoonia phaeophyticola TaxID=3137369 RepID=A0ABZ2V2H0_9RHOB